MLGRSPGCDIGLVSPEVAPVHCLIVRTMSGWRIRDCSGRATRINGKSIQDEPLRNGDVLQIGTFSFEAKLPAVAGHARRAPARRRPRRATVVSTIDAERERLSRPAGAWRTSPWACAAGSATTRTSAGQRAGAEGPRAAAQRPRADRAAAAPRAQGPPGEERDGDGPGAHGRRQGAGRRRETRPAPRPARPNWTATPTTSAARPTASTRSGRVRPAGRGRARRGRGGTDPAAGRQVKEQRKLETWQQHLARRHAELEAMAGQLTEVLQHERDQFEAERAEMLQERDARSRREKAEIARMRAELERARGRGRRRRPGPRDGRREREFRPARVGAEAPPGSPAAPQEHDVQAAEPPGVDAAQPSGVNR